MSRHVPRHDRWQPHGTTEFRAAGGLRVFFLRGAWWAEVAYRLLAEGAMPGDPAAWEAHTDQLGPFKRPRNAMVDAERHATYLQRHHVERIAPGPE